MTRINYGLVREADVTILSDGAPIAHTTNIDMHEIKRGVSVSDKGYMHARHIRGDVIKLVILTIRTDSAANLSQRKQTRQHIGIMRRRSPQSDKEKPMNRSLVFAAALSVLAPCLPAVSLVSPAAAETVVKHNPHRTVVVKKPSHGTVAARARRGNRIMWQRPPARPGHFWHRGTWFVRVHGPAFHYPRGWHYRAWVIGAILPPIFLTSDYFYDDYVALGLQAPAPGYRWVRYGDDLLLVNLRTGEVEDVAYNVFD